jgi:hypothetical protein
MKRETYIEDVKFEFAKSNVDVEEIIANFKKEHNYKINIKIEPILNAILSSEKIRDEDKDLLYTDVIGNLNIYYYMDKDVFLKLFYYINGTSILKKLKTLKNDIIADKIPAALVIAPLKTEGTLTKDLKNLYHERYNNLLLRYVNYLINLFSK